MDQPLTVSFRESRRQLNAEANYLVGVQGTGGQFHVQGHTGYVLGDQKVGATLVSEFKNGGDVGVVKASKRQGLFAETPTGAFVGEQAWRDDLERNFALE